MCNGLNSKEALLDPVNASESYCNSLTFNIDPTQHNEFFICSNFEHQCTHPLLTTSKGTICKCGGPLEHPICLINSRNGFVTNNDASYIIKDDLSVLPLTVDARPLSLLGDMGLENTDSLKEVTDLIDENKLYIYDYICRSNFISISIF